jgi:uncharacterized protein YjbJ (UPF0337 family)
MNENPLDKWNKIKGMAKETWADLTEEDFNKADGSVFKLYGVIQVRFGDTRESIKTRLKKTNQTGN